MALIHADFVEETTTTTGTGTLSLGGATTGNRTFVAAIGNGNTCIYGITSSNGNFESGTGTVVAGSPDTLERTTLLSSSTGAKLNLPAGTHRVYCTFAGEGGTKAYAAEAVTAAITPAAKTVLDDTTVSAMVDTLGGAAATGSGGLVRATSPTLVTPALGTPASGNLVNCTGLSDTGKNRIINGDFRINQRGVSGTVTLAAWAYGHDRWQAMGSGCTYTFASVNGLTTITITAGTLRQAIEDVNLPPGTNPCTLSWTGTAQGAIDVTASGTSPRTATLTGGNHKYVSFTAGTVANVQLELGSIATPFSMRSYSAEELLCKRYFQRIGGIEGNVLTHWIYVGAAVAVGSYALFPVLMRVSPSITQPIVWTVTNITTPTAQIFGVGPSGISYYFGTTAAGSASYSAPLGGGFWCSAEL